MDTQIIIAKGVSIVLWISVPDYYFSLLPAVLPEFHTQQILRLESSETLSQIMKCKSLCLREN